MLLSSHTPCITVPLRRELGRYSGGLGTKQRTLSRQLFDRSTGSNFGGRTLETRVCRHSPLADRECRAFCSTALAVFGFATSQFCLGCGVVRTTLYGARRRSRARLGANVLDQEKQDPWLSHEPSPNTTPPFPDQQQASSSDPLSLHRSLAYSTTMQRALRERSAALSEHRLLTIPFRSVEEYLARLQLTATAVADCQSLAMFFLPAAVSDFYIPRHKRAEHKIQSSNSSTGTGTGTGNLVLELEPVPKTIGLLRTHWAPRAFCVSFKLETDAALLRQKANHAVVCTRWRGICCTAATVKCGCWHPINRPSCIPPVPRTGLLRN